MTSVLDWLAENGFLLAGGLMILATICFIIMIVIVIKAHNEYINEGYAFDEETDDERQRRNNSNAVMIATVAVIACM